MHYKLLGFLQVGTVRTFWFHRIGPLGTTPISFRVLADTWVARQYQVALQDLPSLCSRMLNATPDDGPGGARLVSEREISLYGAELDAARAETEAARKQRALQCSRIRKPETVAEAHGGARERGPLREDRFEAILETKAELKSRFDSAFKRYSVQTTRLRELQASLPSHSSSVHVCALREQWLAHDKAECEYRSVRLEYARRLLAPGTGE